MKLQFTGVGSAFTLPNRELGQTLEDCDWQSNALITADSGKKMLIDCGSDIRFALWQMKMSYKDISAIYISHCHADHIGGLEWLAFCRMFDPSSGPHPILYCERSLVSELWQALCPGLNSIEGQVCHLEDFFEVRPVDVNDSFIWEGITFSPIQSVHVMAGKKIKNSFGLMIDCGKKVYFTTDSQHCPNQLDVFYKEADAIFHDCETSKFPSRVHAHFNYLKTLAAAIKSKMTLYHYQPNPDQDPIAEGFKGFAKKGQIFEF